MEFYHADHTPENDILCLKRISDYHCDGETGAQLMTPRLWVSTKAQQKFGEAPRDVRECIEKRRSP